MDREGGSTTRRRSRVYAGAITSQIALLVILAAAPQAGASVVSLTGMTLAIRASPGERNVFAIEPAGMDHVVSDQGAPLAAGPGCEASPVAPPTSAPAPAPPAPPAAAPDPPTVTCPGPVLAIVVDAGDKDDLIGLWDVVAPVVATGGTGNDLIETGSAADRVSGNAGVDSLVLGAGDDQAAGGTGDDLIQGDDGADRVQGDGGADMVDGGPGSGDVVSGGSANDLLRGGPGDDTVDGNAGNDVLLGGGGTDSLDTGTGTDVVFAADGDPDDVTCRPGDRVRADRGERPPGCQTLPASVTAPVRWPPPATTGAVTATAAIVPPDPKVRIRLRRRGAARRISVRLPSRVDGVVTLAFHVYARDRHEVGTFLRNIHTKHWQSFTEPAPGPGAWYVRGLCCR